MGHLHSEPGQYDLTVSAFIVKTDTEHQRLLLHKHKKLNSWLQPGGHVELNENPWAALTHEILEETGYTPEQLNVLQPSSSPVFKTITNNIIHPFPIVTSSHGFQKWKGHYHTDLTYAVTTTEHPSQVVADEESNELSWFSLEELKSIPETEIFPGIREIGIQVLTYFVDNWFEVPFTSFSGKNPDFF